MGIAKATFKALTTPGEPANAGHFRPLKVKADPGSFFHAVYPAATFTQWSAIVATELIHKALAPAIDSIPASSGGDEPGFMAVRFDPPARPSLVVSNNHGIGLGATPGPNRRPAPPPTP